MKKIIALIKSEPAVFLGALGTAAVAVYQVVTGKLDWQTAEPIVTGFVVRFFVSPANA